jgi:hypothetical protein
MALPKIDVPTYDIELPISKKQIRYRPFLVKEQRNLLMAMESDDTNSVHSAIRDILYNCTLTENVDVEKLPIVDVEYYFLNIRAKSVGEVVESRYRCNNIVEDKECGNIMEKPINLLTVTVDTKNQVNPEIKITDKLTVKMKYPEFGIIKDSIELDNDTEITFHLLAQCVEYIYDGDQFYYGNETPLQEMVEFVENLNQESFEKLEEYFNSLPKLKEKIEMTCSKCSFHHSIDVEGLESFFA